MTDDYTVQNEVARIAEIQLGVLKSIQDLHMTDASLDKAVALVGMSLQEINTKLDAMMRGNMEVCHTESDRILKLENCVNLVIKDLEAIKKITARIAWLFASTIISALIITAAQHLQIHF